MNTSPLSSPGPWNLVSAAYADELVSSFEHYSAEALRRAQVPPGGAIVDVAAGPGTLSVLAARTGHKVSALDFSEGMIAQLRRRLERERLTNVDVRVGDGMKLPFPDGTFQGAFSMFGLMFFPDRARGFGELHRVLADGARAVVSSWLPLDRIPVLALALATLRELVPPPAGTPPFAPPLAQRDECIAEMSAARFRDVEVVEVTHESRAPSTKELWASMERTTAPLSLAKSLLGERWAAVSRAIEDRLVGAFGDGPQTMRMPAFLTIGVR
ncbi:MAG: methyltransferase domain-containing protein [Myxococcota bacterium]|nr:methyltransferase domain-containing protein [Myxococcota bacterium]